MKILIKRVFMMMLAVALTAGFTSCSDDDDPAGVPGGDGTTAPTSEWKAEGYYKGDIYDNGTANLWVNIITADMKYDSDEEDYIGPGHIICLDFNTAIPENPDFATLAEGDYSADDTHDSGTINIDGESFVTTYGPDGYEGSAEVTAGTVTVSRSGDLYVIDGTVTTDDGKETKIRYVGRLTFYNRSTSGEMSNLTSDVTLTSLTQGVAMYAGQLFTETSDYYMLILAGADYDLDENFGNAPSLSFGLNVTPGASDGIPTGTYDIIDVAEADDYPVGTALSGFYEAAYGGYYGTWYFHSLDALEAAVKSGTVKVTNKGNGSYDIEFNLRDGYGHTVKGSYSGPLALADVS